MADWRVLEPTETPDKHTCVTVMLPVPSAALYYSFPPQGKLAKLIYDTWGFETRRDLVDGDGRVVRPHHIVLPGTVLYTHVQYTTRQSPPQPAGAHRANEDCALVHNNRGELIAKVPVALDGTSSAADVLGNKVGWCFLKDSLGNEMKNEQKILPGTKVWIDNISWTQSIYKS